MQPDSRFASQPPEFWAHVRLVSQVAGYTDRTTHAVKTHTAEQTALALSRAGLGTSHVLLADGSPTALGVRLAGYFSFRAAVLNEHVRPSLMDADQARSAFTSLKRQLRPRCPLPLNKQSGKKRTPNYMTGMVNMLVEASAGACPVAYDPRSLVTITRAGEPVHVLSRHVDGCFPATHNPVAVWETKEYYYTTTFGSRVAGGIYETLLDGMELRDLRARHGVCVAHYLIVDGRYTWWECGRSYLCRLVDLLHMGYVDEILFGREALERLPALVGEWVTALQARRA